jgi:tetrahydromethanopterin S-methyltransferase subunit F
LKIHQIARVAVFAHFLSISLLAQNVNTVDLIPTVNAPYSSIGFGEMTPLNYVSSLGMGGLSAAYNDPFNLNILNPASLAYLRSTSFEVGLKFKNAIFQEEDITNQNWTGNLSHLALGFPLINPINEAVDRKEPKLGLGMYFGLQPYSEVGYSIGQRINSGKITSASNLYKGSGGTYLFSFGNAFRYKAFAVGVRIGRVFGEETSNKRIELDSFENSFNTELTNKYQLSAWTWNLGLQYTIQLKETNFSTSRLILGFYGDSQAEFNIEGTQFYYAESYAGSIDTVKYEENLSKNGRLPSAWTGGITYENIGKLRMGLEFGIGNWSQYRNELKPDQLANSSRLAFGIEWIPNIGSFDSYWEKVRYRGGFYTQKDPRVVAGEQLREMGITIGAGFPLVLPRQQVSFVNLAIQMGTIGDPSILRERFIKLNLGFTLNDNTWFYKRKFN